MADEHYSEFGSGRRPSMWVRRHDEYDSWRRMRKTAREKT
jgi:hypothetical protein